MTNPRTGIHHSAEDELFWGAAFEQEAACTEPPMPTSPFHSAQRRTCDMLGLCQHRQPACPGCTTHDTQSLPADRFYFAPGVIDHGDGHATGLTRRLMRRRRQRRVLRWASWVSIAVLVVGALASCSYVFGRVYGLLEGGVL